MAITKSREIRTGPTGVAREDLARLLALRHADPHSILGAHPTDRGVIVRAFRPDAASVTVITDEGDRYPMVATRAASLT